jgi:hypothetical protein
MKGKLAFKIIQYVVGKNSAHIARKLQTFIGGLLLSSALFTGVIDPDIAGNLDGYNPLTPGEISDGLTGGELIRAVLGFILIWASRIMSFLRARNLDWAAEWAGLLIGRSIHSLGRALFVVYASMLAYLGINEDPEGAISLERILAAAIAFAMAGIYSSLQDEKDNPKDTSPAGNTIFG